MKGFMISLIETECDFLSFFLFETKKLYFCNSNEVTYVLKIL